MLDKEKDWRMCIERLVDEYTKRGDSVLVFFKNESEMKKYSGGDPAGLGVSFGDLSEVLAGVHLVHAARMC